MKQYLELLCEVHFNGTHKEAARENMPGTTSTFGDQIKFNLQEGFPILTTKEVDFNSVVIELLWFLNKDPNIKFMVDRGVNIWNEDAYNYFRKLFPESTASLATFVGRVKAGYRRNGSDYRYGDTGNQYPKVWRDLEAGNKPNIDQITRVIKNLRDTPFSRRHVVSAVDVANDEDLALYWCHSLFQFNVRSIPEADRTLFGPKYFLDCKLYQRSADVILGVPYNISSYSLLTMIIAEYLNMEPGMFIHSFGDVHLYDNHLVAAQTQISRRPGKLPTLRFTRDFTELVNVSKQVGNGIEHFFSGLTPSMFILDGYEPLDKIKAKLNTGMINNHMKDTIEDQVKNIIGDDALNSIKRRESRTFIGIAGNPFAQAEAHEFHKKKDNPIDGGSNFKDVGDGKEK